MKPLVIWDTLMIICCHCNGTDRTGQRSEDVMNNGPVWIHMGVRVDGKLFLAVRYKRYRQHDLGLSPVIHGCIFDNYNLLQLYIGYHSRNFIAYVTQMLIWIYAVNILLW